MFDLADIREKADEVKQSILGWIEHDDARGNRVERMLKGIELNTRASTDVEYEFLTQVEQATLENDPASPCGWDTAIIEFPVVPQGAVWVYSNVSLEGYWLQACDFSGDNSGNNAINSSALYLDSDIVGPYFAQQTGILDASDSANQQIGLTGYYALQNPVVVTEGRRLRIKVTGFASLIPTEVWGEWTELTLEGDWTGGPLEYRVSNLGNVELRVDPDGVNLTGTGDTQIAILPLAYRPAETISSGDLEITPGASINSINGDTEYSPSENWSWVMEDAPSFTVPIFYKALGQLREYKQRTRRLAMSYADSSPEPGPRHTSVSQPNFGEAAEVPDERETVQPPAVPSNSRKDAAEPS